MGQHLHNLFVEQYGESVAAAIEAGKFSGRHMLEIEEQAETALDAALRESYIDVICERQPKES
jgi:hypothetical protein